MEEFPSPWAEALIKEHQIIIRMEKDLPNGIPAYKYESEEGAVVVMDKTLPVERLNFAFSHELAHILLEHSDEVDANEEKEANRFASELLMPFDEFSRLAHESLEALKEYFPQASYEAIANRKLFFNPGVLTVYDNEFFTRRVMSDGFAAPLNPTDIEKKVIFECYSAKGPITHYMDNLVLNATYVDTGRGFRRVLLLVEES